MTTVTMIFPRPVRLTVREGDGVTVRTLAFDAGAQEVPEEHAGHPYLAANGVTRYDARAQAERLRAEADALLAKAEAADKAAGLAAAKAAKETTGGDVGQVTGAGDEDGAATGDQGAQGSDGEAEGAGDAQAAGDAAGDASDAGQGKGKPGRRKGR